MRGLYYRVRELRTVGRRSKTGRWLRVPCPVERGRGATGRSIKYIGISRVVAVLVGSGSMIWHFVDIGDTEYTGAKSYKHLQGSRRSGPTEWDIASPPFRASVRGPIPCSGLGGGAD